MNCPNCQQPVVPRASFCGCCGTHLTGTGAAASGGPHMSGVGAPAAALVGTSMDCDAATTANGARGSATASGPEILNRITRILLSPKAAWTTIEGERTPPARLFSGYVAPLTLLAVMITFVHVAVIGVSLPFGGTLRIPLMAAITHAVVQFVMGLIGVGLISLIVNLLAPTFGGQRDSHKALQVAAYSLTPAYLSVLFGLLPSFGTLLSLLAGLYGIYVLCLGLPVMMRSKADKAASYTAAVVICTIILGIILGAVSAAVGIGRAHGLGAFSASQDREVSDKEAAAAVANTLGSILGTDKKGEAGIASALSNLAQSGQQLEHNRAMTASQARGEVTSPASDTSQGEANPLAATAGLVTALGGALGGPRRHEPVDFHQLEALLPAALPGMSRMHVEGNTNQALGVRGTSATATYRGNGAASVQIHIADATAVSGLVDLASSLSANSSSESDSGYEKVVRIGGRPVHEKYDRNAEHGEISILVAKRFEVDVTGNGVAMDELQEVLSVIDFGALEALQDAGAGTG
jgi:hypothetical protein